MGGKSCNGQHESHSREVFAARPWEPRTKLVAGVIFVFGVISINNLWLLAAALVFAASFAFIAGLPPVMLLKRLTLIAPFLALMALPLVFSAGYPPAADRLVLASVIVLKALTAMTFTLFVFTNQPVEEMLETLEHLKVPAALTTTIYLAYRYGFLFIHEMQTTQRALKSRLLKAQLTRSSLPVYGELSGGLFIKSINRSETVYRAMAARSFRGSMPVGEPRQIVPADWAKSALPLIFIAALVAIEQVVL